jgi:predicted  nucleic acid-binding Zn-ribbon protein
VQTKHASANDYFHEPPENDDNDQAKAAGGIIPTIEPYKGLLEPAVAPPAAPAMAREHSNSVSQKRALAARRQSPATSNELPKEDVLGVEESESMLRSLTDQLDKLRDETEKVDKHIQDEEVDYQKNHTRLTKDRDSLRKALNEREGASRKLRQQVSKMEHDERAASSKRNNLERQLQQKHNEREKLKSDMAKWDQEIEKLRAASEQLVQKKVVYRDETEKTISELREQHASAIDAHQAVEESIKLKKSQIKQLEDEKQQMDQFDSMRGPQFFASVEEENQWRQRLAELQFKYNEAWQALEHARQQYHETQTWLSYWEHRRQSEPHMFTPSPTMDLLPSRRQSLRRARAPSLRNELSPQAPPFEIGSSAPGMPSISTISPNYPPVSSFFNIANGTVIAPPNLMNHLSPSEIDHLTAGAPTSPSAGNFLPSDLLSDVDIEPDKTIGPQTTPLSTNMLPGLGDPKALEQANPSSPASAQSRSPSVFASPRESQTNLSHYPGADGIIDSDRRSIRSNTGSGRVSLSGNNATSRFTSLFGFSRQRGKTFSDDGPSLGSLRAAESQSFPRSDVSEQDLIGSRRRGSHGERSWMDMLHRGTSSGADTGAPSASRRRFNVFGGKTDSWPPSKGDRPPSPRPASTASSETNLLPRPSTETQSRFGWPVPGDGLGPRPSPLGQDWGLTATNSWSRHPSRRPSIQYGSSLNLGPEASIFEADDNGNPLRSGSDADLMPRRDSPKQAPIGTRPKSAASSGPKLNPAAPSFTTLLFSRDKKPEDPEKPKKEKEKKDKKSKEKEFKGKERSPAPEITIDTPSKDTSPADGRKSKEARSISTAGDTASEPRDSLERSISRTPSEVAGGASSISGSIPKESFMQRLSRKSSTGMFSFTARNKDGKGSSRFSSKKTGGARPSEHNSTPDETDEESGNLVISKSYEGLAESAKGGTSPLIGAGNSPSVGPRESLENRRSGFSFRSLTGRKNKAPSIQESLASATSASEAGDEREHDEGNIEEEV